MKEDLSCLGADEWPEQARRLLWIGMCRGLLLDLLLDRRRRVEFGSLLVSSRDAERLFQEFTGQQTVAAVVPFGLQGGLAFGRDDEFDEPGHQEFSKWAI